MVAMATLTYVLLRIGKGVLVENEVPTHPDASDGFFAVRTGKGYALLLSDASPDSLSDDAEEAAEELATHLGPDLLSAHDDARGVLVAPADVFAEPPGRTYDELVVALAPTGRWITNAGPSLRVVAGARGELPLPDYPKSKPVEFYVMSPARAMRELGLDKPATRVVRADSFARAKPAEVSAFYLPKLKALGFKTKRRVWSDGSAEELVGEQVEARLMVYAEKSGAREVFVQLTHVER